MRPAAVSNESFSLALVFSGHRRSQVHFETDISGTQTNLTTGKVRRVQKLMKGEPMPAWEGTGIRRRAAAGAAGAPAQASLGAAPAQSAAQAAQASREKRRSGYDAGKAVQPHALRPQVSQSAYKASAPAPAPSKPKPATTNPTSTSATGHVPRYMRPLKSKA